MGHLSIYRRMVFWGVGTLMAVVGAVKIAPVIVGYPSEGMTNDLLYLLLLLAGLGVVIINETVFSVRKTQLEIDSDETIIGTTEKDSHTPMILAICPQCKSRIPSESKYCPECGTDLQRRTPTPSNV